MSDHELPLYKVVTPPPPHYASPSTPHNDLPIEPNMNNYHLDLKLAMEEMLASASASSPDNTRDVEAKPLRTLLALQNPVVGERFRRPVWGFWAFFALVMGLVCLSFLLPALIMYFSTPHRSTAK